MSMESLQKALQARIPREYAEEVTSLLLQNPVERRSIVLTSYFRDSLAQIISPNDTQDVLSHLRDVPAVIPGQPYYNAPASSNESDVVKQADTTPVTTASVVTETLPATSASSAEEVDPETGTIAAVAAPLPANGHAKVRLTKTFDKLEEIAETLTIDTTLPPEEQIKMAAGVISTALGLPATVAQVRRVIRLMPAVPRRDVLQSLLDTAEHGRMIVGRTFLGEAPQPEKENTSGLQEDTSKQHSGSNYCEEEDADDECGADVDILGEEDFDQDGEIVQFEQEDFAALGIDPYRPTTAKPGSEKKVLVLTARYAAGVPLWHNEDLYEHGPRGGFMGRDMSEP